MISQRAIQPVITIIGIISAWTLGKLGDGYGFAQVIILVLVCIILATNTYHVSRSADRENLTQTRRLVQIHKNVRRLMRAQGMDVPDEARLVANRDRLHRWSNIARYRLENCKLLRKRNHA